MVPKCLTRERSILILDDEFDIVTIITDLLKKHGFHTYGFTEPSLALEHFQYNYKDYSLVLSDIRMPAMSGLEFAERAKAINPKVKILLMSAFEMADFEFSSKIMKIIDDFVQKPIYSKKLIGMVQKHMVKVENYY